MIYKEIETKDYIEIMSKYHVGSLLAKIISSFDYSEEEIASFFAPLTAFTFDNEEFKCIKDELVQIKHSEKSVFVFGDYDCDGLCSTAIMMKLLKKMNIEAGFYIPDRLTEGYGLNVDKLAMAYEKGYRVLFTVDNGVSALEALKWAKEHDMRVIITDHHIIPAEFNKEKHCDFLLHPSLLEEKYANLCGAGLVYMLAEYMNLSDDSIKALAMIATISDVMSLKGANIKIINDGLDVLNRNCFQNITKLDNFNLPLNEEDIGYKIAPKLNAVGRMSDIANANNAVRYLLLDDIKDITMGANEITKINQLRQKLSNEQSKIVENLLDDSQNVNLVFVNNLHEGLLGLIASKISHATNKITFIFTNANGLVKGSGRGVNGVDLMRLLSGYKNHFMHFGGHALACGITMKQQEYNGFKEYLLNYICDCDIDNTEMVLNVDCQQLNMDNIKEVFNYRPYGQDRRIPLVKTTIKGFKSYKPMKTANQLKWVCDDINFVSFNNNKGYQYYLGMDEVSIIGELKENKYYGKTNYQIIIKEILE